MFPYNRYYFCDYFNSKCIKQLDFSWFNSTAVNTNRPECLEWKEIGKVEARLSDILASFLS